MAFMSRTQNEKYAGKQKYDWMLEGKTWCLRTVVDQVQWGLSQSFLATVFCCIRVFSLVFCPAHDRHLLKKYCEWLFVFFKVSVQQEEID